MPITLLKTIQRLALCLFSAGWLLPATASIYIYLGFWESEGWGLLRGDATRVNSAPLFAMSADLAVLGAAWLGAVIVCWVWIATKNWGQTRLP